MTVPVAMATQHHCVRLTYSPRHDAGGFGRDACTPRLRVGPGEGLLLGVVVEPQPERPVGLVRTVSSASTQILVKHARSPFLGGAGAPELHGVQRQSGDVGCEDVEVSNSCTKGRSFVSSQGVRGTLASDPSLTAARNAQPRDALLRPSKKSIRRATHGQSLERTWAVGRLGSLVRGSSLCSALVRCRVVKCGCLGAVGLCAERLGRAQSSGLGGRVETRESADDEAC
jgi:hypothetical protein